MEILVQFAICAVVILFAGNQLSHCAELIADKLGFSKSWVGLVLLGITASSSQLATSVSSVTLHNLPDMAIGGLMGSCMFNMMVIGLLDLTSKEKPISNMVHNGHILSAGFAIVLIGLTAIDILFNKYLPIAEIPNRMDPITLAFVPAYLIAMRLTFNFEISRRSEVQESVRASSPEDYGQPWFKLISLFLIYAIAILSASCYLPSLAEKIQAATGWGQSFIGSSFIAVTTCLPELAIAISAARRGSFDIAVASLIGSTLCYIVILSITDFCYPGEPLLRHASPADGLAALSAMISMGIVVIGLTYRAKKKLLFMAGDAAALVLVYFLANALIFVAH